MRANRWRGAWLIPAGLVGSQWGHVLAYQLRFGARAAEIESTGGHAYFPTLMSGVMAVVGLVAIVSLGLVGAARVAGGRRAGHSIARPSVVDLLAVLFTLHLAVFGVQEAVESFAAGAGLDPAVFLYGVACQLPTALVGAIALSLFLARLEEAVESLREQAAQPWPGLHPAVRLPKYATDEFRPAPEHLLAGQSSRGPPPTSR